MADRILVTGGGGFVGYHLAQRLLSDGAEVVILDDFSRSRPDRDFDRLRKHVQVVEHDLRLAIPAALLPGDFDGVYHLAAVVGVQRTIDNPVNVLRTNVLSTLNLLDWCLASPPGMLFFSSTSEVADGAVTAGLTELPAPEQVPYVATEPWSPRTSYSLSKVTGELLVTQCAKDFPVRIGRYHNVYGPRMGNSHVIPQFLRRALDGVDPFPIYGANQTRAFCYVDDAVSATVAVARSAPAKVVANIGNDTQEITARDLAAHIFTVAGVQPRVEIFGPPPGSPDRRLPDLTTLRTLTGYQPRVNLAEGLRMTYEWYAQ
ncbi:NAD-dependent epimerase/dehydratase family protein [Actinocrispum wychmicini]|uniref:UDP-glucose 4-epimerase/UDP-glucuronate decarboxylase n=1 Tax=Actinocrispum wychmicini TaxID=1213861 RepID=A0A4R2JP63_9PSEU|nr:NAD-dependent epimerase/dehydratase family protein [Actinocrispum wychmicini]TCO61933.1 UDP-glucose 4-epimerase/UDP-glucuronate decarboxylase [Actinocrispum wychmicini]